MHGPKTGFDLNARRSMVRFSIVATAALLVACGWAAPRTTILVPLPSEPSWHDMAFLAAIPAATFANNGTPSLIALDRSAEVGPEIDDYARRYRPERVFVVCERPKALELGGSPAKSITGRNPESVALKLSNTFWRKSKSAVICSTEDFESALVASSVAALLKAPLLFSTSEGASEATLQELERLGVSELTLIGTDIGNLAKRPWKVTFLKDASAAMAWARRRGFRVRYLAAVNPTDRNQTVVRKLSLAGAMLAATRGGLVAPLRYETEWKVPATTAPIARGVPFGVPNSAATAKDGAINLTETKLSLVLTGDREERNLRLSIDVDGDGIYSEEGEGPFASGDTVQIGKKRYAVSLGTRTSFGKTDVHLTWPTAEEVCDDLGEYYRQLGAPPESLCLVGFPDAIPQAIIGRGGVVEEQASDLPFANADDDPFAEIGVARLIGENVSFATLYASRVSTYRNLLSREWQNRACGSQWENSYKDLFENVGFEASHHHTSSDLKWVTPPANGKPGVRSESFDQASPLAACAAWTHGDHSWWRGLGGTTAWDSNVLIAPSVVESSGCGTACLDREPDYRSVVARLFRQGATAFFGSSREAIAQQEPGRQEFWNEVLGGGSIGEANKRAINSVLLAILDRKEDAGGAYRYALNIHTLFGDPAFRMHVPSKTRSAPARVTVRGDKVSVFAPAKWWPVSITVPPDWKQWADKSLYVVRGAGAYALSSWCDEGFNLEKMMVTAEFTTRRRVAKIEQVQQPKAPLGWQQTWYCDDNADGSHTYRWAVQMVDFDQIRGRTTSEIDRLDYRITFE